MSVCNANCLPARKLFLEVVNVVKQSLFGSFQAPNYLIRFGDGKLVGWVEEGFSFWVLLLVLQESTRQMAYVYHDLCPSCDFEILSATLREVTARNWAGKGFLQLSLELV